MAAPTVVKPLRTLALEGLVVPEGEAVPFAVPEAPDPEAAVALGGAELAGAVEEAAASTPVATAATAEMLTPPVGESTPEETTGKDAVGTAFAFEMKASMVFPVVAALIDPTIPNVQ